MEAVLSRYQTVDADAVTHWFRAAPITAFPEEGGACVRYKDLQIAVFNFSRRGQWYACQNLCPHKMQMVIARGMTGDYQGQPKVACPFHKKTFSLLDGSNIEGTECSLATYPVRVEAGYVYIGMAD